jgi:hypothetical protein
MAADEIWTRRDGESPAAYDAFKTYLYQGKDRTLENVREASGRTRASVEALSVKHDWIARTIAYDSYIVNAHTDGLVHALAETRDKNLALMDKLRGLLDSRLDDFIARRDDPTIRWTQACVAMTKIEANSLAMADTKKTSERVQHVEELIEKALELRSRVPEEM